MAEDHLRVVSNKDLTKEELQLIIMMRTLQPYEKIEIKLLDDQPKPNRKVSIVRTSTIKMVLSLD